MRRWLDRIFQREEMDGDGRCATYLVRWTLLKWWGGRGLYLHHFVGDDWSRDLHDHPKRFISIGLWGTYVEQVANRERLRLAAENGGREPNIYPCGCSRLKVGVGLCDQFSDPERFYRAPWVRTFPADHIHRIRLIDGRPCWTLVVVLKTVRKWGFWHRGSWIPWREYVNSETATRMKSCP